MGMNPRTLRPSASGFNPRQISGLALWLDAADSQTLYTTDAGPVTAVSAPTEISGCVGWYDFSDSSSLTVTSGSIDACNDKSGNGFHLSASSTNRPTLASAVRNGRNAAEFDGVNDLMTATFSGTYTAATVFAVVYPDTAGGGSLGRILTRGASNLAYDGTNTALRYNAPFTGATGNGGQRTANGSAAQDQWHLASFTWNGGLNVATDITPYLSGVTSNAALTGTGDAVSTTGINDFILGNRSLADGADRGWDGYIGEIIIFNTALSTANRARVEAYLAAKWGITGVHAQATAANDPVGAWLDKSGNGRHATQATGAARPTISGTQVGSRRGLSVTSTQGLTTGGTNLSLSQPNTVFAVIRTGGAAAAGTIVDGAAGGTRQIVSYSTASGVVNQWAGTAFVPIGGAQANTVTGVIAGFSGAASRGAVNSRSFWLAGNPGTNGLSTGVVVGNFTNFSQPLAGQIAELGIYNKLLTESEAARLTAYFVAKYGIALIPQVSNADAQDWINRVYAAGGTCSATTASAVNTFCDSITNAGIRDRFYRLNLFCGNSDASLNAVRTPLYRGPSLAGTQYGGTTDTHVNFVQGDYAENTGLTGSTTVNKYLNTGLAQNILDATSRHLAAYESVPGNQAYGCIIGSGASSPNSTWFLGYPSPATTVRYGSHTSAFYANSSSPGPAFFVGSNNATTGFLYRNGVLAGTSSNSTAQTPNTDNIAVFGQISSGSFINRVSSRLNGYSIGAAFTAAQALDYYNAMQAFQTALGRNV